MKRKKWMALVMLLVLVVMAACDDSEASETAVWKNGEMYVVEGSEGAQQAGTHAKNWEAAHTDVQPDETMNDQQLIIYYRNGRADGLQTELVAGKELTPEALMEALARHNIVSIDTKVQKFERLEEQEGVILKLELSKAFAEYLKTMGERSEEVVMAALVNTFLHNYQADGGGRTGFRDEICQL